MCSTGGNILVAADRPQMSAKSLNVSLAQVELRCFFVFFQVSFLLLVSV